MAARRNRPWLDLAGCLLLSIPGFLILRNLSRVGWSCGALENPFDEELVGYLLEWGYRFLGGNEISASIWSPPFFFPEQNVLAYSDTFFTAYPFYFPARWLGADPHQALLFFWVCQLWLTPVLTYACARWLGLRCFAALVCAITFGWSWARYFHTGHIQFSAGWLIPLFFALLYRGFRERRLTWLAVALWTFVAQFYLSVYIAYFLAIVTALIGLAVILLERRQLRGALGSFWQEARSPIRRRKQIATVGAAALALLLLAYGGARYGAASQTLGGGDPLDAARFSVSFSGWLRPYPTNLVWGRLAPLFPTDPLAVWEKRSFIGWVAPLLCLATPLLLGRRSRRSFAWDLHPSVLVSASLVVPFVIVFVSDYPPRFDFLEAPMALARRIVPGATAIRATGRICLVLSFLTSFVAATWVQVLARSPRKTAVLGSGALAAVLVLENLAPVPAAGDRCAFQRPWLAIEPRILELKRARNLGTLLFLPTEMFSIERVFNQVAAMGLALRSGLRIINGYSGHAPPWLDPLFVANPRVLHCSALRGVVDAAQAELNQPTLIYVEREGPLGAPAYGADEVSRCLSQCLADSAPVAIEAEGRAGIGLITDSSRRCAEP